MKSLQLPIEYFKCHMTIRLPAFLSDCNLANKRKMFRLIFEERYRNEDTIQKLDEYISEMSESLRTSWDEKSLKYQREYKDPVYFLQQNPKKKKEAISIRAKNRRMLEAVRSAKRKYEHFQKTIEAWNEAKSK